MQKVVIVSGVRTAGGSFGGSLQTKAAPELGAIVIREVLQRAGVQGDVLSRSSAAGSRPRDRRRYYKQHQVM